MSAAASTVIGRAGLIQQFAHQQIFWLIKSKYFALGIP
jgi:hypothetical protein